MFIKELGRVVLLIVALFTVVPVRIAISACLLTFSMLCLLVVASTVIVTEAIVWIWEL